MSPDHEPSLSLLFSMLTLLGGAGTLFYVAGLFRPHPDGHSVPPPVTFRKVLWTFGAYFAVQIFAYPLIVIAIALMVQNKSQTEDIIAAMLEGPWPQLGVLLAGIAVVLLIAFRLPYRRLMWNRRGKGSFFAILIAGVAGWSLCYPTVIALGELAAYVVNYFQIEAAGEQVAVQYFRSTVDSPVLLIVSTGAITLLVPLVEEILFRGLLQSWLRHFCSPKGAVLITSFCFALIHFTPAQGATNIALMPSLFILSCVLGYLYERQGNLWVPITVHALFNITTVGLLLLGV